MTPVPADTRFSCYSCNVDQRLEHRSTLPLAAVATAAQQEQQCCNASGGGGGSSSRSKKHKKMNRSKQTAVAACGPSAPTLDAQHAAALGQFAAQVLQGFLAAAGKAFQARVLQHLATAGAPVHPRVAAIGQQIMDSGYVQLLPRLLTFAAEQMQAEVHVGSSSGGSSGSSSSSGGGGGGGRAVPSHADPAVHWDQLVMYTFSSYYMLHLWCNSKGATTTTPACATAVLRAAATTFRVVHARLEPALQSCTESGRKKAQYSLKLWSAAEVAVRMVLEPFAASEGGTGSQTSGDISGSTLQEYKTALIKCPGTSPCVVINTAAPLISILLLHSPQLPDLSPNSSSTIDNSSGSSNGGHGGGSSRSRSVAASSTARTTAEGRSRAELASCINAAASWKLACSQHSKLPPTLQQLLHEVGCSSTTLIAAAAHGAADELGRATQPTAAACTGLQATLQSMVRIYLAITDALLCADQRQQQQQQQQQQWDKLHALMPTLLLYSVAHQPAGFAADGQAAALAYLRGTEAADNALRVGPDGPDWESLHLAVFQDVLPLAMQAGEAVLAAVNSSSSSGGSAPAPVQAALASTSSSGGSGLGAAPLASADSRTSLRIGADPFVLGSICYTLLNVVCGLCQFSGSDGQKRHSGHNSSSSSSGDAESVWGMQHVLTLGRLFEVTLRSWPQLGLAGLTPLHLPFLVESLITYGPVLKAATAVMHHEEPPPASGGAAAAAASSTAVQAHAAGVSSSNSSSGSSSADIAPELTQFLGVTVSLLKLCSNFDPVSDTEVGRVVDFTSRQVSGAVAKMLPGTSFNCPVWTEGGFKPGGPLQTMQWFVSEEQAIQGVPFLALLGRALLFTAQLGTRVLQGGGVNPVGAAAVGSLGSYPRQDLVAAVQDNVEFTRQHIARDVKLWLQDDRVQSAWAAAGYDRAGLLKVAQAACAESTEEAEQIAGLRVLGLALCTLAHLYACNNPTYMCGGCRVAHYCSRACQRQHWKVHKPVCQAIAATQAAKQAGGGQ